MIKQCAYSECGKEFEAKSPKAKYCSELHRNYDFRKNNPGYRKRTMAGIDQPMNQLTQDNNPLIPALPVQKLNRISQQLDPASQMVFELLKEQNAELRSELKQKTKDHADEIKKLTEKLEVLTREKSESEKARDEAQRNLSAKPTGLAGLVSSQPDLIKDALPILSGFLEKVMKPSETLPPFVVWLKAQDEKFQQDFMAMVSAVMQDTKRLEMVNRSLMSASSPQQQVVAGASRYS